MKIEKEQTMRKKINGKRVLEAPLLNDKSVCPGCLENSGFRIIRNESVKDEYPQWNCPIRYYALCKKCNVVVQYVKDIVIKNK
ncbi:MAG: hypothetical protein AB2421_08915 [Thermotaleaceae bacterium]